MYIYEYVYVYIHMYVYVCEHICILIEKIISNYVHIFHTHIQKLVNIHTSL
jgi:hypothetical protein